MTTEESGGASTSFCDYIRDVPMLLGQHFYPLPYVDVRDVDDQITYPIDALEDEYDFSAERSAVTRYSQSLIDDEQRALDHILKRKKEEDWRRQKDDDAKKRSPPQIRQLPMMTLLQPTMLEPTTSTAPTNGHASSPMDSWAPIAPANPFDTLEMKSLDDRALLQQILSSSASPSTMVSSPPLVVTAATAMQPMQPPKP